MAKPTISDIGSSCHIHVSVWDTEDNARMADPSAPHDLSGVGRSFLGGLLEHTPELFWLFAPNVNSYKRFQSASFAPTAVTWGRDNRTAGFRIVGHGQSRRVECRIPGADVNPYLGYAALLAAGLDGIANLYASDRFYLGVLSQVREALSAKYGVADAQLEFFDAVLGDAKENVAWEEEVLPHWACSTERQLLSARAFRERLDIEGQCLYSLAEMLTGKSPFQAPRGAEIPLLVGNEITPVQA